VANRISLFKFQQEDVDKLKKVKSRLIANDPGTGKTYEGIALDLEMRRQNITPTAIQEGQVLNGPLNARAKTLILCPKSVISVWDSHCMELTDLDVTVIDAKKRDQFIRMALNPNQGGYFIMHWDALSRMPELRKVPWLHVIGDEIHRAKNRKAQVTIALWKLKTQYKTAMSGTPADNAPQDLWAILHWLWPNYYTSFWNFVNVYVEQITNDPNTGEPLGYRKFVGPNEETIGNLHKEIEPWYTRRRKEDVLPDLPNKYYTRVWVDLDPKQRRAYDQMRKTMIAWVDQHKDELDREDPIIANAAVSQLVRLQQFACGYVIPRLDANGNHVFKWKWNYPSKTMSNAQRAEFRNRWLEAGMTDDEIEMSGAAKRVYQYDVTDPSSKLDTILDILEDRNEEQIVIFSQFRSVIDLLAQRLAKKGITYGLLTGAINDADRAKAVEDFQAKRIRVFAGTIAAGGVGLTLTAASTVVFIDRVWSPAVNGQAEDRLHRIGQTEAVEVIDLMARHTVDLGKASKIRTKARWLQMLLGDKVDPELLIKDLEAEMKGIEELFNDDTDE